MTIRSFFWCAAFALPAAAAAQVQSDAAAGQAQAAQPAPAQQQQQQAPAQAQQQGCAAAAQSGQAQGQKRHGMGHDVGNAAAGGASQVAGAAVAGPIGAAVAPVVVNHVGRKLKHAIKGRKPPQQQAQAAADQPACGGQPAQ